MPAITEKRDTTRLSFETEVILSDKEQKTYCGKILNLSASGALIEIDDALPLGQVYTVAITLQGDTSNIRIENLDATVIRHAPYCMAVKFTAPMEWLTVFYIYRQKLKGFTGYPKMSTL